ncbi:MAG: J domain-containing protein [Clostridia bacterium]|nr:J domain-containing protein [Clostridia bacterium]
MKDPYEILGVPKSATDDEIKAAYRALARKYHPDNFEDTNPLKELATEKMQQINEAYDEIMRMRQASAKGNFDTGSHFSSQGGAHGNIPPIYMTIREKINKKRFGEAENLLMSVAESERIAEWHFLYSIILFKRGRVNDAMRELEIACMADPSNTEYQQAKQMFNSGASTYGSIYYGPEPERDCACCASGDVCDTCMHLALCDCICECFGGDLIPCL